MDFDPIKTMKVKDLKTYLQLHGFKVSVRNEDLVARVFAVKENNMQPIKTAQDVEVEVKRIHRETNS